jgi:hypothetical protein
MDSPLTHHHAYPGLHAHKHKVQQSGSTRPGLGPDDKAGASSRVDSSAQERGGTLEGPSHVAVSFRATWRTSAPGRALPVVTRVSPDAQLGGRLSGGELCEASGGLRPVSDIHGDEIAAAKRTVAPATAAA